METPMKTLLMLLLCVVLMVPALAEARCRTIGESASLGSEYGTFPLYPAEQVVEAGQKRDSIAMQWLGYGIGVPLFVVAMPFAMVGAGAGAVSHPWTKCQPMDGRFEGADVHLAGADR